MSKYILPNDVDMTNKILLFRHDQEPPSWWLNSIQHFRNEHPKMGNSLINSYHDLLLDKHGIKFYVDPKTYDRYITYKNLEDYVMFTLRWA